MLIFIHFVYGIVHRDDVKVHSEICISIFWRYSVYSSVVCAWDSIICVFCSTCSFRIIVYTLTFIFPEWNVEYIAVLLMYVWKFLHFFSPLQCVKRSEGDYWIQLCLSVHQPFLVNRIELSIFIRLLSNFIEIFSYRYIC